MSLNDLPLSLWSCSAGKKILDIPILYTALRKFGGVTLKPAKKDCHKALLPLPWGPCNQKQPKDSVPRSVRPGKAWPRPLGKGAHCALLPLPWGLSKGRRRRRKEHKTALPTLPAEQGGPDEASHNAASEAMTAILQEGAELE